MLLTFSFAPLALATEGGGGRPITGQQIAEGAGVVPPEPGFVVTLASIYYDGELKAGKQVPLIGAVSSGMDSRVSYNLANLTYVWNTGPGRWNFASGIGLPLQYTDIRASLTTPRAGIGTSDSSTQLSDLYLMPISAGYHISKTEHFSLSLPIYAPTGAYDVNRLANAGQNTWTFMPSVGYTRLGEASEFSALAAFEFYTPNHATDYHSGVLFRLDALWTTKVAAAWQLGVAGGWIEQVTDDKGATADRLDGFRGRSIGLGPIANWTGKLWNMPGTFSVRWVPEFEARNRPKGNGVQASLNLSLF
ncbi:transporter [Ramlibacter solisilvae]|uniref:Phenol degradation protein meta n=1 Tax=Ramlibacter tataouinensis TaxID=94132 RepID=A0A127JPG0_9BURK|nr:phenol degradation protein meta [Ramlibacter tataouinensis]